MTHTSTEQHLKDIEQALRLAREAHQHEVDAYRPELYKPECDRRPKDQLDRLCDLICLLQNILYAAQQAASRAQVVPEGYRLQPLSEYEAMCAFVADTAPQPPAEQQAAQKSALGDEGKALAALRYYMHECSGAEPSISVFHRMAEEALEAAAPQPPEALNLHRARVQRFAELVAAKEREACAQIVEKNAALCVASRELHDVLRGSAAAIRARELRDKRDRWKEPINPEPRH